MEIDSLKLVGGTLRGLRLPQKEVGATPARNELFRGNSDKPVEVVSDFVPPVQGYYSRAFHSGNSSYQEADMRSTLGNHIRLEGALEIALDKKNRRIFYKSNTRGGGGWSLSSRFYVELGLWKATYASSSPSSPVWQRLDYRRSQGTNFKYGEIVTDYYYGDLEAGAYMVRLNGCSSDGSDAVLNSENILDIRVQIDEAGQILYVRTASGNPPVSYSSTEQ